MSTPPLGILLVERFFKPYLCQTLIEYAETQTPVRVGVVDHGKTNQQKVVTQVDTKARDSQRIPIDAIEEVLGEIFFNAFLHHVMPYYKVVIDWWERPQFMRYLKGGKYGVHADAEHCCTSESGKQFWKRTLDRDISVLLYLNDTFTGGELDFPDQKYRIKPKPGLLVAFPSTHEFQHAALPTTGGVRYALVSWAAAKSMPRVREKPPYASVYLEDMLAKSRMFPGVKFEALTLDLDGQ